MAVAKTKAPQPNKVLGPIKKFLEMEAAGGIMLVVAAILALLIANSPLYAYYDYILHGINFRIGFNDPVGFDFEIRKNILHWINDGFMAIFFFLVGLEIKREMTTGELSSRSRALLPFLAAAGGMAVPALIYCFFNRDNPPDLAGWAIPSATDIAFSLGVLSLLGNRVPVHLKVLLMAIAVIDDLGAIIIIAIFYSGALNLFPLLFAACALLSMFLLNRRGVSTTTPYILLGVILWMAVLQSGVHATLAGVFTAMFVPMACAKNPAHSPAGSLIHSLHPWVAFGILPLFALTNAGVPFTGMGFYSLFEPVTLGIILGLFIGKQIGIFGALWICIKTGISPMIKDATWLHLYGVALLCGIGFTMSLFIGGLAFADLHHQASIRLGVLVGSILSAIVGFLVLYYAPRK